MGDNGSEVKECWYSILGVEQTASPEVIRSAYRKEALKWHPDKIQQSGASPQECRKATLRFQNIAQAYEVLSDPTERAWYDKHRNEILSSGTASKDFDFSVMSFFSSSIFSGFGDSGKGFYKVYGDVFKKIHKKEQVFAKSYGMGPIGESPGIGSLHTDYSEVDAFYKFWQGFATVKDFSWCDEYRISEARNRKERRLMEEENAKIRKRERREFNDAVRQLATYVKKRDKRVLDKQVELQRLQMEKERELKARRQKFQEDKLAKARAYKEQDWAKISDDLFDEEEDINEDEGSYHWKGNWKPKKDSKAADADSENPDEFYCIICSKRFRSEKQWNNHEKSKKHIDRAAALKQSFLEEDEEADALAKTLEEDDDRPQEASTATDHSGSNGAGKGIGEDEERYEDDESDQDVSGRHGDLQDGATPSKASLSNVDKERAVSDEDELEDDDEDSNLAAMMNSHRNRHTSSIEEAESAVDDHKDDNISDTEVGKSRRDNGGEDNEDVEDEDDEESLLAAMLNTHRSRRPGSTADVEATAENDLKDGVKELERKVGGLGSSDATEEENTSVADDEDEEDSVLGSMLNSQRTRGFLAYEGGTEPSEQTGVAPAAGNEDESEEETRSSKTAAKAKSRRRSKQERQHMAAKERHDDILKELSSPYFRNRPSESNDDDSTLKYSESGTSYTRQDTGNLKASTGAQGKKSKLSKQKQGMQELPIKLAVSESKSKVEVPQVETVKKGLKARGKKGKAAPKPPASNTCDTCGEDFESRNQLFKHITVTNHSSVKTK